ncbi:Os12g0140200 [Oryza sativa Japonica Group]|uniref:Os12g0140200 protein n=1 Tax=Oryza sativa subsp. japonica TaxID=39947 RepID=C7JA74_ORYSJ|nr:Os12g0140200 [Oryza sativa Japonica Group]|eukprot:NP_001176783.1 Os12g0140200 [Oryza sativa Japonica Group]
MDPTTGTCSGCEVTKKIPSWMMRKTLMQCMEAGHFGKDAMDMARLEHALPRGDLHRPRVGSKTAERSCSVCLKNFEEDDYIWSMPCSHTFHQLCVLGDRSCRGPGRFGNFGSRDHELCYVGKMDMEFPDLYNITLTKKITVANVKQGGIDSIKFRRDVLGNKLRNWLKIKQFWGDLVLEDGTKDTLRWSLTKDGKFTVNSFYKALKMQQKASRVSVVMAALGLRVNGEGDERSLVEDEALVLLEEKQASWEELEEAFSVFDGDGDGFISPLELQNVMRRLCLQRDAGHEECERMLKVFDRDGDGMINFDEFKVMMQGVDIFGNQYTQE